MAQTEAAQPVPTDRSGSWKLLRPTYPCLTPALPGRLLPKKRQGSAAFLFPAHLTQSMFYKVRLSIPETLREELWMSQRATRLAGCPFDTANPVPAESGTRA